MLSISNIPRLNNNNKIIHFCLFNIYIAHTTPLSQANDALCEGVRVALALNAPIITRCKCLTASRFLYRLRLGRHTKRGEDQNLITRQIGSDCYGSHFYCEHFFDFFRHTPKQQDRLLGLCHLRSTCGKQRGRFCLPHCYPSFTSKSKDRQNFLLKHAYAAKIFELSLRRFLAF